jgi:hypothetical protein
MKNTNPMMKPIRYGLLTFALMAALAGSRPSMAQAATDNDETTTLSGTMVHTTLEGGCWYLDASDGKHYELVGDEGVVSVLHQEGKYVQIRARPAKNMASVCMVGPIMQVVEDVTPQLHPTDLAVIKIEIIGRMKRDGKKWYVLTNRGLRYDFDGMPARKYRKVGARYRHVDRVIVSPGRNKVSGVILGPVKVTSNTVQKPAGDPR